MKKEEYPEKIYAHGEWNNERHRGEYWDSEQGYDDIEYTRSDLVPRWHDASKELPPTEDYMLCCLNNRCYEVAAFREYDGVRTWYNVYKMPYDRKWVTAWMEIPEYKPNKK